MYFAWKPSPLLGEVPLLGWALAIFDPFYNARTAIPFILMAFIGGFLSRPLSPLWCTVMGGLLTLAVILEIGQLFIETRNFTWADIGFGFLGVAVGASAEVPVRR